MTQPVPAIEISNICFGYESREVLHNINLHIDDGSLAVVVGPNGGGKTTLLRLILGLLEPRYGEIKIFGEKPCGHRREIGYVPQSIVFDKKFPVTVMDVVLMGRIERHIWGGYTREDKMIALDCLFHVGLGDYANVQFSALSGGQRQRVMIAQALASHPKILLLDEPCANLDVTGAEAIFSLLKDLNAKLTIVMVSHNLSMVEAFASHVICVNRTADMHTISEVSSDALVQGNWIHIFHKHCPIELTAEEAGCSCHTPHLGASHPHTETCQQDKE